MVKSNSRLNNLGQEVLSDRPVAMPLGFKRPETLAEQVQRLVRNSISRHAESQGYDSFEDSEDFDIEDDPIDPSTSYEVVFDPVLGREISPRDFIDNEQEYRKQYLAAMKAADDQEDLEAHIERLKQNKDQPVDPNQSED